MDIGVTTRIPQDLKHWLEQEACVHNRSLSKEVKHLIEEAKARKASAAQEQAAQARRSPTGAFTP